MPGDGTVLRGMYVLGDRAVLRNTVVVLGNFFVQGAVCVPELQPADASFSHHGRFGFPNSSVSDR